MVKFSVQFQGKPQVEVSVNNYDRFAEAMYKALPQGWSKGKCIVKCIETSCVEDYWFTGKTMRGFNGQLDYQIERCDFNHPHYLDGIV
jgi:hypothetical protein